MDMIDLAVVTYSIEHLGAETTVKLLLTLMCISAFEMVDERKWLTGDAMDLNTYMY